MRKRRPNRRGTERWRERIASCPMDGICSRTATWMAKRAMPELRFDPLRKEWVAYATERNDRTFLPTDFCPLCPSGKGGASEVPADPFEVVVFETRFPAFGPDRRDGRPVRPSTTGCEVVVYTPEHELTLAQLPIERVRLLVDVWADRYRELGSRTEVEYVYIFENKGEEVGVTLHHPHGQIYALPFVPPFATVELGASREHLDEHGLCLHCSELAAEASGPRNVLDEGSMAAFVPRSARWPYEVHVYPRRHVGSIADVDPHGIGQLRPRDEAVLGRNPGRQRFQPRGQGHRVHGPGRPVRMWQVDRAENACRPRRGFRGRDQDRRPGGQRHASSRS